MEICANCKAAIGSRETPFVWCDDIVCSPCWTNLSARQVPIRSAISFEMARNRFGFGAAAAIMSSIGILYLLAGVEYQLIGASAIGGVLLMAGLAVVAAVPWSSR